MNSTSTNVTNSTSGGGNSSSGGSCGGSSSSGSSGSRSSIPAPGNMHRLATTSLEQRRSFSSGTRHPAGRCHAACSVGPTRMFGGQSVVPWELALFLVEEMKAELVQPGAVVYTAALAECRWAGEQRHVDYLLQEMEAEGLSIVPGIPGAMDDALPPSQASPLFGKLPEAPPSTGSTSEHQSAPGSRGELGPADQDVPASSVSGAVSTMQSAAREAHTALATVETMWARGEGDPSPATCRAALDACAAGGQWERALSLVRDAAASDVGEDSSDRDGGGAEEEDSFPGSVEVLALEGRWDDALLLVQRHTGLSDSEGVGVADHRGSGT
eukprot:g14472.t1